MKKTVAALRLSVENLWQPGFRVYMWTFTFKVVQCDWVASKLFSDFLRELHQSIGGDWSGVKVAELHPGGHGVHYHVLVNRRLSVWAVRLIAPRFAIGRIDVRVCNQNMSEMGQYLAKYLSKSKEGPMSKSGRAVRRWSCFGPIRGTRVSDLVNESPQWVFRRINGMKFLGYRWECFLARCWMLGEDVFKAAWWAGRRCEADVVAGLAMCHLEVVDGVVVERFMCKLRASSSALLVPVVVPHPFAEGPY